MFQAELQIPLSEGEIEIDAELKYLLSAHEDEILEISAKLVEKNRTTLYKQGDALNAFFKIKQYPKEVLNKLKLTDDVLASIGGNMYASYAVVLSDVDKILQKLNKESNATVFANFEEQVLNKLSVKGNATESQRIGAHGILKAISDEFDDLSGKTITFEKRVENAREKASKSAEDMTVEIGIEKQKEIDLRIEVKNCKDCITADVIRSQFIERDLYNASSLEEIRWRIYRQNFTKKDLVNMLEKNRDALEDLLKSGKLQSLVPNERINSVNNFIDKFKIDEIFDKIFRKGQ